MGLTNDDLFLGTFGRGGLRFLDGLLADPFYGDDLGRFLRRSCF